MPKYVRFDIYIQLKIRLGLLAASLCTLASLQAFRKSMAQESTYFKNQGLLPMDEVEAIVQSNGDVGDHIYYALEGVRLILEEYV